MTNQPLLVRIISGTSPYIVISLMRKEENVWSVPLFLISHIIRMSFLRMRQFVT